MIQIKFRNKNNNLYREKGPAVICSTGLNWYNIKS